jgi:hypothetical protein
MGKKMPRHQQSQTGRQAIGPAAQRKEDGLYETVSGGFALLRACFPA